MGRHIKYTNDDRKYSIHIVYRNVEVPYLRQWRFYFER